MKLNKLISKAIKTASIIGCLIMGINVEAASHVINYGAVLKGVKTVSTGTKSSKAKNSMTDTQKIEMPKK